MFGTVTETTRVMKLLGNNVVGRYLLKDENLSRQKLSKSETLFNLLL